MRKILLVVGILAFTFPELRGVNGEKKLNISEATKKKNVPPVESKTTILLQDDKNLTNKTIELDDEIRTICKHKDYRSYIECLLRETKRKKRHCTTGSCGYQKPCPGTGCPIPANQNLCVGDRCPQIQEQPCSGYGCVFVGHTCYGTACTQVDQTCYGIGCVPHSQRPSCGDLPCVNTTPGPPQCPKCEDTSVLREKIDHIKEVLLLVKQQNDKLIDITEKATTLILANKPQPVPNNPQPSNHNLTTSIEISNYVNNTNVVAGINPSEKEKTHCCIVVRPKTCTVIRKPPYLGCGHKKVRTCGAHCSGKKIVHSYVRQECPWYSNDNCISYHSSPYHLGYSGYPTSGYYGPPPLPNYPFFGGQYYPVYAPPGPEIYAPPSLEDDSTNNEECIDCDSEAEESVDDCDDVNVECKVADDKNKRSIQNVIPLAQLRRTKKEVEAIKRSEDQLSTSIDMLEEALELKKLESERRIEGKSETNVKTIMETDLSTTTQPKSSNSVVKSE